MDRNCRGYRGPTSGIEVNNQAVPICSDPIKVNSQAVPVFSDPNLIYDSRRSGRFFDWNADNALVSCSSNLDVKDQLSECDSHEDYDFSDVVLKYINHILMEEDVEEKSCMFQESAALQAAEKSFYDVLGEQRPASTEYQQESILRQGIEKHSLEEGGFSRADGSMGILCPDWCFESNSNGFDKRPVTVNPVSQVVSQSCYSSSSSSGTVIDSQVDSPISTLGIPDIYTDSQSIRQFKRGFEEASKFLPDEGNLIVDLNYDEPFQKEHKEVSASRAVKVEKNLHIKESADVSRGKKNSFHDSMGVEEERSNKQSAVYTESTVSSEMFDKVLLCSKGKNLSDLRKALDEISKKNTSDGQSKESNGGKIQGKKSRGKRNVVDMRTLLTLCAQAVAADDRRTANEFLKQIREHATPTGDGMQRLAHYFADGLEGIMNGAFNAPFFITRFREALFHYSSFFDMLDANIPRECHERMLLEKTVFGREAMNVIACEAAERIERPETYKQWQARCMRAGFEQLPLDKEIKKMVKDRVESFYNKDFVIDEDGHWMMQGWKGRIVYALTSWKPTH